MEGCSYEEKKKACDVKSLEQEMAYKNRRLDEVEYRYEQMHANFHKVTIGLTSKLITSDTSLKEKELMYQIEISSRDIRLLEMERKYKETYQGFEQLLAQKDLEKRSLMDQIEEVIKEKFQNPSEGDSDLTAEITKLKNQLEENLS
ncbi:hypothetical protein Patl1_06411 [Pistacia atlantica]|uniref:Uncharacterized protein n=1 Tax=Pistacia atlantica TaxID=434234 RepID=A0ACC1BV89_9ROSI|nr:hypothetical protein Patl1_06411 [Pistacia atlantica]